MKIKPESLLLAIVLALLAVLALSWRAHGSELGLAWSWDASPSEGQVNYRIYAHTNELVQTNYMSSVVKLWAGTNLTCTVNDLVPARWWFAVTANRDFVESDISNVVTVEVPEPPKQMRTVVLQFSGTLTNFSDVGFFKLRLP